MLLVTKIWLRFPNTALSTQTSPFVFRAQVCTSHCLWQMRASGEAGKDCNPPACTAKRKAPSDCLAASGCCCCVPWWFSCFAGWGLFCDWWLGLTVQLLMHVPPYVPMDRLRTKGSSWESLASKDLHERTCIKGSSWEDLHQRIFMRRFASKDPHQRMFIKWSQYNASHLAVTTYASAAAQQVHRGEPQSEQTTPTQSNITNMLILGTIIHA